jgi:SAM-dependent methyltransferase
MARRRNSKFIETGKANFIVSDFIKAELHNITFDKILGFNVNRFWKDPTIELELIKSCLKPKGLLYIFYQAPNEIDIRAAWPLIEKLQNNSFQIVDSIFKKMIPASAFCVIAKPMNNRLVKENYA